MAEEEAPKVLTTIEMIEKVKDTEEFKTLVTNNSKQYIGGELKTVYNSFDTAIKDVLGLEKPDNVKSTEWVKQNLSKLTEVQKEIEALKNKGDEGNKEQEKLWNDKFNKLTDQLTTKEQELIDITQKGFKNNVNNQLDNFLVGKTFKPSYSEDDVQTLVPAKKAMIIDNTRKLDNGKVAVYNPSKDQYYTDTLGEPLTPVQVADLLFKSMFQIKSPGGDAPSGEQTTITKGDVLVIDMNKIKTRGEFYDAFNLKIAPKGLPSHSEEFKKIQNATMAHYKIPNLPLS